MICSADPAKKIQVRCQSVKESLVNYNNWMIMIVIVLQIIITQVFLIKKRVLVKRYLIFTKLRKQGCKLHKSGKMPALIKS
jgi:hypothetical protein